MSGAEEKRDRIGALLRRGLERHQAGALGEARAAYEAVLGLEGDQADALHLLGVLADQEGRPGEAVELIGRAIAANPGEARFHGNLGTALLALGRLDEAAAAYEAALRLEPGEIDATYNLGNLRRRQGRSAEARALLEAVLAKDPNHPDANHNLGVLHLEARDFAAALPLLRHAVALNPRNAAANDALASALRSLGELTEAMIHHRRAIKLAPDVGLYRENLGTTLYRGDHWKEAIGVFKEALAIAPRRVSSLAGIANALLKMQQPREAAPYVDAALELEPENPSVLMAKAAVLSDCGDVDGARACLDRAASVHPDDPTALLAMAYMRQYLGDYAAARADYEQAMKGKAENVDDAQAIAFNYALLLLATGDLDRGWRAYGARRRRRTRETRVLQVPKLLPVWDGVMRPGLRLMVWGEQGVGDEVLYAGMLPDLMARANSVPGSEIILVCDPRLVLPFRRSFPGIRVEGEMTNFDRFQTQADAQIALPDLGALLRPSLESFPPAKAYLVPDRARVAGFRARYQAGQRFTVGISWRSSNPALGRYKSATLADWLPVLRLPGIRFIDVQYGDTAEERARLNRESGIDVYRDPDLDLSADLDGAIAQLSSLDLIISVSNSTVHFAGAAGVPTWVCVPFGMGRLWYWFVDQDRSIWYENVRIIRKKPSAFDEWSEIAERVAQVLRDWSK